MHAEKFTNHKVNNSMKHHQIKHTHIINITKHQNLRIIPTSALLQVTTSLQR